MIYIVEIERKNGHTNVCHCSLRRIDIAKGDYLMPRSFEGDEKWKMKDYAAKILEFILLDKPKQIIFDTFGFSRGLYADFMGQVKGEIEVDYYGNIKYPEYVAEVVER